MSAEAHATVLVVEDDPGIAELERSRLEDAGYRVAAAGTADEAFARLRAGGVDLVLLDYRLPGGVDGLDFHARVKAAGIEVPVILVTGFSDEATVIRALRAGVRDFVTKSVEYLDYLPEAVGRVLAQVGTERELAESRALFAAVIATAKDAILVTDGDHRVTLFNPAAEKMFRCPSAAAVGRPVTDFIPNELGPADGNGEADPTVSHRVRTGTRGVRAGGEEFPLEASVSRANVAGRRFYTVVVRDVTDRKRAEAELRRAKEEWEQCLNALTDHVCILDRSGTILRANRAMRDRFGPTHGELVGKDYRLIYCGTTDPHPPPPCAAALTDGTAVAVETPLPALGGWYAVASYPLRDRDRGQWGAVSVVRDITDRKRAEEQIREQAALLDLAHDAIKVEDLYGTVRYWNRGAERMYGWTAAEAVGRNVVGLIYQGNSDELRAVRRQVERRGEWTGRLRQVTRDGREIVAQCSWSRIRDATGRPDGVLVICTDVTERAALEQQLRQAQKMEVVGQLAGGVAHDFNNLLTVINGFSDLALEVLPAGDPVRGMVEEVRRSGERASDLTRQLLTLSRQQVVEPKVLDLNAVVREAARMLRRLIGEDVELATTLAPGLRKVKADPGQVEQVLMNLAVNARDAMPRGGRLTVETRNADLDEAAARGRPGARPGRYVVLRVSDTGHGMTEAVKARIFEPFFTTKEEGKGTGLGLATVFGIVAQAGGHITVESAVGRGTTFEVYFPATRDTAHGSKSQIALPDDRPGTETVLLAEDDAAVRAFAGGVLRAAGYTVLEARDAAAVVDLCERW